MWKDDFAEVSKNLDRYRSEIILNHQINYVENSSIINNAAKSFHIIAIFFSYTLYKGSIKLFLDLCLANFLDILAKPFFLCRKKMRRCTKCINHKNPISEILDIKIRRTHFYVS